MSEQPRTNLALALAALERAMASTTPASASPDLRRIAHRLADLVRTEATDRANFARRHLPGREIDPAALESAQGALRRFDRLLALLGRGVDAELRLTQINSMLEQGLAEIEPMAAPIPEPSLAPPVLHAGEVAPEMTPAAVLPAPAAVLPTPAAGLPAPAAGLPVAESLLPSGTSLRPVTAHHAHGIAGPETAPVDLGALTPRPTARRTAEMSIATLNEPPGKVLPFTGKAAARPSAAPHAEPSGILPFRRSSASLASPLPEHLRALDLTSYATYRVLSELYPARRAELFAHYGIADETTADLLDAYFRMRVATVPGLQAEWEPVYARLLAYYRGT